MNVTKSARAYLDRVPENHLAYTAEQLMRRLLARIDFLETTPPRPAPRRRPRRRFVGTR